MTVWSLIDIAVLFLVTLLTGIIIPQILLIAFRKNLFDEPDPRKIHKTEVPRLGGIAFFPSILFALLLLFGLGIMNGDQSVTGLLYSRVVPLCFTGCAAILLYLTGMADDLVGVRYRAKFVMQTLAALLIIAGGIRIQNLHGFCGIHEMPYWVSLGVTALFIVFVINAVNLIDGIDGLASGLSGVACAFYAIVCLRNGLYTYSALAAATSGTLLPFFFFNVFGDALKHRKIFMGDTGALTVGLFLSVMCISICRLDMPAHRGNSAVIGVAPLLIPGFDVIRVYIHRIRSNRNPFLPDKTHIHHKLLALGMRQRRAMMTILGSSALLTAANYCLSPFVDITLLFIGDVILWVAVNMLMTRKIHAREKRLGVKLYK